MKCALCKAKLVLYSISEGTGKYIYICKKCKHTITCVYKKEVQRGKGNKLS